MATASRRISNAAVNPPLPHVVAPGGGPPNSLSERRNSRWDGLRRLTLSSVHRQSFAGSSRRPTMARVAVPQRLENTYRFDCEPGDRFRPGPVQAAVEEMLREAVGETVYEPESSSFLSKRLAGAIKALVRDLGFCRYKLVVMVFVGPAGASGAPDMAIASRCLWRPESGDSFAEALYENASLYVHAIVFAAYYE